MSGGRWSDRYCCSSKSASLIGSAVSSAWLKVLGAGRRGGGGGGEGPAAGGQRLADVPGVLEALAGVLGQGLLHHRGQGGQLGEPLRERLRLVVDDAVEHGGNGFPPEGPPPRQELV